MGTAVIKTGKLADFKAGENAKSIALISGEGFTVNGFDKI